jgi:hypothetical protein
VDDMPRADTIGKKEKDTGCLNCQKKGNYVNKFPDKKKHESIEDDDQSHQHTIQFAKQKFQWMRI